MCFLAIESRSAADRHGRKRVHGPHPPAHGASVPSLATEDAFSALAAYVEAQYRMVNQIKMIIVCVVGCDLCGSASVLP